ncbi:polysaccharide biosynthesis tyrosine autokinase [Phocaeicola barnesiae]|uniref:GumC family protein n=1 Tax=Phocaeicola barnesiae TaxID=376804 RepID=UPI0025A457DE|nr:polysaccharide biosynthesis tyrosine autokinase [Phocaeicola barnesiae]MDM8242677.1 polysaccharide biosynthesis tyrosine autokinase [Phocaeicola barnesiae]
MQTNPSSRKNDTGINLVDLLAYFASKWKWFLLSVLVCGGIAWYHYARSPLVYFRSATVIIKDPSNKTSTTGLDRFDNIINKVNVANEILQFRSKKLMREVLQRLHADISYQLEDGLRSNELYNQSPVLLSFPDALPEQHFAFTVTLKDKKSLVLSDFTGIDVKSDFTVEMYDTVTLSRGMRVVATPTNYYNDSWTGTPIRVAKLPMESMVNYYKSALGIQQEEEESSILTLALKDGSAARAEDILNTLINVYNEEAIKDKNQVAVNTADFINDRLIIIENELGGVESELETFKQRNQIVDIASSAGMYMSESQKYNTDALELETQLRLANFIKDYLTDPAKETDLIPSNTGIGDMNIESQINLYNTAKLKRDHLIDDSSANNPVVLELNNSLRAMKQNIIRAVDNMIVSLNVQRSDAQSREMRAQNRITSIPTKERKMLSIERQQKVKEALYLFLLNKREENALSQAMADNNARVIDGAEGSNSPISPNRNRILLLGLLVGLAIPSLACLGILFLDTRVHSRKDVEDIVSVPYLGEIPQDKEAGKLNEQESPFLLAKEQRDSTVSEAFRILRTNMAFMARKDLPQQVIIFTSLNEGAGKTFISKNLGMSLVLAKKKVILIDMDIRRGTLSRQLHLHKTGLTNYLADATLSAEDIIQHQDGFDIIAAGAIAPNPAELLMDERLDNLVTELRRRYDYIVVDSVPVGIIADATISNRIADLTIFVARAGRLDRRQLPEIEQLYKENKLHNMALVLNGADLHRRYGYYGYYGYSYKYGYGKKKK